MELVFATNNLHKLGEVEAMLDERFRLVSLAGLGIHEDIPEDHETLEENASQKAWYIYDRYKRNCFADDTGLEVDALNGAPGVYSARFARMGEPCFPGMEASEGNIRKLLLLMQGKRDRKARFRSVFSLIIDGSEYRFEGIAEGRIADRPTGEGGFGYDPVFIPDGHSQSFAEMERSLKNSMSHRALATSALVDFLLKL